MVARQAGAGFAPFPASGLCGPHCSNGEAGQSMATYIVQGTLKHDGVTFEHGSEFTTDDEELVKRLRFYGALALPGEALPAEQIAAREEALKTRIAELEAEAAHAAADKSGESGEGNGEGEEPAGESEQ